MEESWLLPLQLKLKYEPFNNCYIEGDPDRNLDIEDKFKIVEMIGRGGYGIVFSTLDMKTGKKLAIKVSL